MRALTLWQPWAWAMAAGIKRVENRSWEPPAWLLGNRFALHASMRWDQRSHDTLEAALDPDDPDVPERNELVFGALVAVCTLDVVVTKADEVDRWAGPGQSRWFFGPFGWVVSNIIPLDHPVPCRGYQGLWTIPKEALYQMRGASVD